MPSLPIGASPAPSASPSPDPLAGIELLVGATPDPTLQVPAEDLASVVRGNTAFAFDLLRAITGNDGNLVLGPLSLSTALAMEHQGARGATAQQMADTLHLDLPADRLAAAFAVLDRELEGLAGPNLTVRMVSQLFGQTGYPFEEAFLETLGARFDAPLAAVDFRDTEATRLLINAWVAAQTEGRITDILGPGILSSTTEMALANATDLTAQWAEPFEVAVTERHRFHRPPADPVTVSMMTAEGTFRVAVRPGYRAVELPYDGDRLAMLVVMPANIAGFERALTPARLDAVVGSLKPRLTDLWLPRFQARSNADLSGPLMKMGIVDAFQPGIADLSGIGPTELAISAVIHEAYVKVTEKGTEAAAATIVETGDSGFQGTPVTMHIDHSFLWFIRDRVTGSILFLGRVTDPNEQA